MRWTLSLLALLTVAAPAAAEDPPEPSVTQAAPAVDLDALMAQLSETYSEVSAVQASFTQKSRSQMYGEGPSQPGTVTIARPRRMSITFGGDMPSQFISDGETLWVYSPVNNQVIVTPDMSDSSDGISDLLESLSSLQERFEVTALPAAVGSQTISLAPKDGAQFKGLQLTFDDALRLTRLEIVDKLDTVTIMDFDSFELNPALPEGMFAFEAPEGTTVVRTDRF
jgi:outer membrane lipoprotein-sorting protein